MKRGVDFSPSFFYFYKLHNSNKNAKVWFDFFSDLYCKSGI